MKVKCKCGYEWNSNSKLEYVSCPSCLQKVRIRVVEKINHPKEEKVEVQEEDKEKIIAEQRKKYLED